LIVNVRILESVIPEWQLSNTFRAIEKSAPADEAGPDIAPITA
jgi:hypothetical protein